ncbi:MBL fold metallo-hydrolase [Gottfriedia acidiceleris]|uniref:MBL fold metallo-hydrolase n=1 Tax=Gottfriedia acidiceleris TaxID=371036 RepID=UPI003000298B
MKEQKLAIDVYHAEEANVNAYIFSDNKGTFIVDCTRNSEEARKVAALALSKGSIPKTMLITHGHPDHYLGMGAILQEFPDLKIVVASQEVKDDIISFTEWMDSVSWLEGEPHMKPISEQYPDGFDYKMRLEVLETNEIVLPGGSVLEVNTDYPPTESAHVTTLYSRDLNAFISSDLTYNKVHIWLGVGVEREHIKNWQEQLVLLKEKYGPLEPTVYPGHGDPTDISIFEIDKKYMDDLLNAVQISETEDEAKQKMMKLYPDWQNTEFLLTQSVKNQIELFRK